MRRFSLWWLSLAAGWLLFQTVCMPQRLMARGNNEYSYGGIVRGDASRKQVCLVFTGAAWADGASVIIPVLKEKHVPGGFFFTGQFYERYPDVVRQLLRDGHYVGSHGYGHLLYCAWEKRDSLLVTRKVFTEDMLRAYRQMERAGIRKRRAPYFIPSYEYYNDSISSWARRLGLQVINFTPGSGSNADYTIPSMKNYRSSEELYCRMMDYEKKHTLNGHFLMFHFGTHPERTDKFYRLLPLLIDELRSRGYKFVSVHEMVSP